MKIDAGEKELLESVERGEWQSAGGGKRERNRYARYAKATFRKIRSPGHVPSGTRAVRLEVLTGADDILCSDFEAWHFALNYWYLPKDHADGRRFEAQLRRRGLDFYRTKPLRDRWAHDAIERSWDKIFTIRRNSTKRTSVGIREEGAGRRGTTGGATGRVPCRVISRSWYCCSENGSPRRSMRYFASNQLGAATFHCAPRRHTGMNLRSLREVNTSPVMMSPS